MPVVITRCVEPARAATVALRAVVLFVEVDAVGARLTVVRPAVAARAGAAPATLLRVADALRVVVALRAVCVRVVDVVVAPDAAPDALLRRAGKCSPYSPEFPVLPVRYA